MRLIELHIIQSFPVSCLNRDDVGSPKTAVFGGANRARISSQCLKRAIREMTKNKECGNASKFFQGDRTHLIVEPLMKELEANGVESGMAKDTAKRIAAHLANLDDVAEKKGKFQTKTLIFLSPMEISNVAKSVAAVLKMDAKAKELEKGIAKACKEAALKDAADIAIFGRMVANDASLTLEGAGLFSHALSTHKVDNDIDFFSAVDDKKSREEDAGAGMIGTLEFNSGTYYRYVGLNLDVLADKDHLASLTMDQRKKIVDFFIRAALMAVPGARKNSMNAHTRPAYVLGVAKEKGQPVQMINAFEKPVWGKDGLQVASIEALKKHHAEMKKTWKIETAAEVEIPDKDVDAFCAELVNHVI